MCALKTLEICSTIYSNEISRLVNVLKFATTLINLELRIKNITPDEATCLVDQIKQITGLNFLTLHYSSPASSIKALLDGLVGIAASASLRLSFKEVDKEGVLALGSGLKLHTNTNISELYMTNSSIDPDGATGLANGLRHLTELRTLHLSHNNIGHECFNSLCNGLQYLTSLWYLDLSHNDINDDDTSSLGHLLHHLTRLSLLGLSHTNIGLGMSHLVSGLQGLTEITILNLSLNNISSDGASSLAHTFQYLTNLKYLYLPHNNIGADGMTSLAGGLMHLTELRWLDISHNNIDLEGAKTIITSLKGCHKLDTAVINLEYVYNTSGEIIVHGLVSPDKTTAIADLVAAAESEKQDRTGLVKRSHTHKTNLRPSPP